MREYDYTHADVFYVARQLKDLRKNPKITTSEKVEIDLAVKYLDHYGDILESEEVE